MTNNRLRCMLLKSRKNARACMDVIATDICINDILYIKKPTDFWIVTWALCLMFCLSFIWSCLVLDQSCLILSLTSA